MSDHRAQIHWRRSTADFVYDTYNRGHEVRFKEGKVVLNSSAAPQFRGDGVGVDPEEAFVASLSSCHMLTFLALCARKRLVVDAYDDEAVGHLEKGPLGKVWMARVALHPRVRFAPGTAIDTGILDDLHHRAHEECFIANSVKTDVSVEPAG